MDDQTLFSLNEHLHCPIQLRPYIHSNPIRLFVHVLSFSMSHDPSYFVLRNQIVKLVQLFQDRLNVELDELSNNESKQFVTNCCTVNSLANAAYNDMLQQSL